MATHLNHLAAAILIINHNIQVRFYREKWEILLNYQQKPTFNVRYELPHDKTNKMACAPNEDSDQPGHPPSLISFFAVRMKKVCVLSYPLSAQRRLSLRWVHSHFVGFVMRRLISVSMLKILTIIIFILIFSLSKIGTLPIFSDVLLKIAIILLQFLAKCGETFRIGLVHFLLVFPTLEK